MRRLARHLFTLCSAVSLALLVAILQCCAGAAETTSTVATPARAQEAPPRVRIADGSPVEAMRSLQRAIEAGDEAAIRFLTRARPGRQQAALEARIKGWARIRAFFDALNARFDRDEVNEAFGGLGLLYPTRWINLDDATVRVDGDVAMIFSGPIRGQKMTREDGRWKAFFGGATEQTVEELLRMSAPLAEAMARTTPEIRDGEYGDVRAVNRVFMARARAAGLEEKSVQRQDDDQR